MTDFAEWIPSSTALSGAAERVASHVHVSMEQLKSQLPPQVSEFAGIVFLATILVFLGAVLALDCLSRRKYKFKQLEGEEDEEGEKSTASSPPDGEAEDEDNEFGYDRQGGAESEGAEASSSSSRATRSTRSAFAKPGETPTSAYRYETEDEGEDEGIRTPPPSAKNRSVPTSTRSTHRSRTQSRIRGFPGNTSMTPASRRPQRAAKLASGFASAGRDSRRFDRDAGGFLRPIARKLDLGDE